MSDQPFAYIAYKGEYWAGLISPAAGATALGKFMREFVRDGFAVVSVASRAEYDARMATMKEWSESPDFVPKKRRAKATTVSTHSATAE